MATSVKICPECGEINRTWREHCSACQTLLIDEPVIYKDIPAVRETKGDEEGTETRNSTGMKEIIEGMTQVLELTGQLGNFYNAHPSPENEILVKCAVLLGAYNLALDHLVHSPTYGEAEIRKLIEILEQHDPEEVALLQKFLPHIGHIHIPSDRQKLRQEYANRLMEKLNMTVGMGRLYLLAREMEKRGMSDEEISRAIESAKPQNPF
jgi:hypothetical protein